MKNENKMEDMVDILTHMHQYVPFHAETKTLEVQGAEGSEQVQIQIERLHRILIGGDQLTAERVKGAQNLRKNSTHAVGRLEGLVPVSEDWHAKVCFLQVLHAHLIYQHWVDTIILFLIGDMETSFWEGKFFHRVWDTYTT